MTPKKTLFSLLLLLFFFFFFFLLSLTHTDLRKMVKISNNNSLKPGHHPPLPLQVTTTTTSYKLLNGNGGGGRVSKVDTPPSPPTDTVPPESGPTGSTVRDSGSPLIGLVFGLVAVGLLVVGSLVYFSYHKFIIRGKSVSELEMNNGVVEVLSDLQHQHGGDISIEVILQVTENFHERNIIGKGGFGTVYKGVLEDGTLIAVKRMESHPRNSQGVNEFEAEIGVLTKVRHRHLVALLGFSCSAHERLIIYEYMSQGTLGGHLFDYPKNGTPPLTWKQRITIALDVARGVEYLHSLAHHTFIHRDLKPTNILLGDDMRAKVADFGLVRKTPDGKYSLETRLAGTFGYLAPEYTVTGRVTIKVDVYAYGAILMQLITGRKALDYTMPEDSVHLVTWFRRDVLDDEDNLRNVVDPTLDRNDESTFRSIYAVAELAGYCTIRDPDQRPDMSYIVGSLASLGGQWVPSQQEEEEHHDIDIPESLSTALERWRLSADSSTGPDEAMATTSTSMGAFHHMQ